MTPQDLQEISRRLASTPKAGWPAAETWSELLHATLREAGFELDIDSFFDVAAMAAFLAHAPTDMERLLTAVEMEKRPAA